MKFKEIYALLPGEFVPLTEWPLRSHWLPELPELDMQMCDELLAAMEALGRMKVKVHLRENYDGDRYAQLSSLWFDGVPVALIQEAGRSGRDHRQRWVSDAAAYELLLDFVRGEMKPCIENVVDGEKDTYPDTLLEFYGTDFAGKLGIKTDPRMADVHLIRGDNLCDIKMREDTHLVVFKKDAQPPEYARRGAYHLRRVEDLSKTPEWKASHARQLLEHRGLDNAHSYEEIEREQVPAGAAVVRI